MNEIQDNKTDSIEPCVLMKTIDGLDHKEVEIIHNMKGIRKMSGINTSTSYTIFVQNMEEPHFESGINYLRGYVLAFPKDAIILDLRYWFAKLKKCDICKIKITAWYKYDNTTHEFNNNFEPLTTWTNVFIIRHEQGFTGEYPESSYISLKQKTFTMKDVRYLKDKYGYTLDDIYMQAHLEAYYKGDPYRSVQNMTTIISTNPLSSVRDFNQEIWKMIVNNMVMRTDISLHEMSISIATIFRNKLPEYSKTCMVVNYEISPFDNDKYGGYINGDINKYAVISRFEDGLHLHIKVELISDQYIVIHHNANQRDDTVYMEKKLTIHDLKAKILKDVDPRMIVLSDEKNRTLGNAEVIGNVFTNNAKIDVKMLTEIPLEEYTKVEIKSLASKILDRIFFDRINKNHGVDKDIAQRRYLYENRETHYDLTIRLGEHNERTMVTFMLLKSDLDNGPGFIGLYYRNRDNYADGKERMVNIDMKGATFGSFTIEQNRDVLSHIIRYCYLHTMEFDIDWFIANCECLMVWTDFMGMKTISDALGEAIKNDHIIEYQKRIFSNVSTFGDKSVTIEPIVASDN